MPPPLAAARFEATQNRQCLPRLLTPRLGTANTSGNLANTAGGLCTVHHERDHDLSWIASPEAQSTVESWSVNWWHYVSRLLSQRGVPMLPGGPTNCGPLFNSVFLFLVVSSWIPANVSSRHMAPHAPFGCDRHLRVAHYIAP